MNTFFWSTRTILSALDAGILNVQAEYNRQYINGINLFGVGQRAHDHAIQATMIAFRTEENYQAVLREDRLINNLFSTIAA